MKQDSTIPNYRADIDGLRALAILLVVFYHAFPKLCPGGFLGVSVFFVISGYLISGIILKKLFAGKFSFLDFYARRCRRILPALTLVLATVWIAGRALLWTDEFKSLGMHIFNSAFFTENIWLANETNYFGVAAELKPLLHFWSLGIEEQFYLFWPIVLAAAFRLKRPWREVLLCGLGLSSLFYKLHASDPTHPDIFFLLPSRFWELALGGALAYWELARPARKRIGNNGVYTALGGAAFSTLIGLSFWGTHSVWATVISNLATFALIAAAGRARITAKLLSHPMAVFVGKISYPLYLWHWVLLSFARIQYYHEGQAELGALVALLAVALSFLLAWLTYRLIEQPAQQKLFASFALRKRNWGYVLSGVAALLVLGGTGFATHKGRLLTAEQRGQEKILDAYDRFKRDVHARDSQYRTECNLSTVKVADPTCYTPKSEKRIFIWGDSHAQHINYGLTQTLPRDFSILQIASSLCRPSIRNDGSEKCNRANAFALEKIRETKPTVVLLAQDKAQESTPWLEIARRLKEYGVQNVLVLGPVPQWYPDLYQIVAHYYLEKLPEYLARGIQDEIFKTDRQMKERFSSSTELTYVSFLDKLCKGHACLTTVGPDLYNDLLTSDGGHFSFAGSIFVAKKILSPAVLARVTALP